LARQVTAMLHGETELEKAVRASEVLFGKEISGLGVNEILDIFADVPSTELEKSSWRATVSPWATLWSCQAWRLQREKPSAWCKAVVSPLTTLA
jgi:tyrosyl-tRNA synthetase